MTNMKRLLGVLFVCGLLLCAATSFAGTYVFQPSDNDLQDLPHANYYAWKIALSVPNTEVIDNAFLTVSSVSNWAYEPNNNWLHMQLMDSMPTNGTKVSKDIWRWNDVDGSGNAWAKKGVHIATYTDNTGNPVNLNYDFKALGLVGTLKNYDSDGAFYLGFDPDCHFNNSGVKLTVTTVPIPPSNSVPEPSGIIAISTALCSLYGFVIKRTRV